MRPTFALSAFDFGPHWNASLIIRLSSFLPCLWISRINKPNMCAQLRYQKCSLINVVCFGESMHRPTPNHLQNFICKNFHCRKASFWTLVTLEKYLVTCTIKRQPNHCYKGNNFEVQTLPKSGMLNPFTHWVQHTDQSLHTVVTCKQGSTTG